MENSSIQRGQKDGPNWGPPARRVPSGNPEAAPPPAEPEPSRAPLQAAVDVPPPPPTLPPPTDWHQPWPGQSPEPKKPTVNHRLAELGSVPTWLIAAVVAASVLLELALRTRLNSVATLLATLVMTMLVISSVRQRHQTVFLALAVAVLGAGVAVVRASLWVTVPTLLMTGSCLVLAGQGQPLGGGLVTAAGQYVRDVTLSIPWLVQPLRAAKGRGITSFGRSFILAAVVVIPLAMLLASADAVFGELLRSFGPGQSWQHAMVTAAVLPFVTAVALSARRADNTGAWRTDQVSATGAGSTTGGTRSGGLSMSMTDTTVVLGSVGLLLAVWGATQIVVALGGADRLLATANLTAAENARHGFFQLVAATAFLIGIIMTVDRFTERTSTTDHLRFLGLTVVIGLETFGIVVATYSRLALYISGFGNTMLRASVAWFLAWLAAVMLMLIVSVNRRTGHRWFNLPWFSRPWFSTALFSLAGLWVLAFGLWNPEAAVARGNLQRGEQAADIDYRYVGRDLGSDAIPTVVDLLPTLDDEHREQLTEDLCRQADDLDRGYRFLSWNRSNARAAAVLKTLGC